MRSYPLFIISASNHSTTSLPPHISITLITNNRYDSRVKAMEVDEKPTDDYGDVGGLDKQIEELNEAIVLPITHRERFEALGIQPPKGNPFPGISISHLPCYRMLDVRPSGNWKDSCS